MTQSDPRTNKIADEPPSAVLNVLYANGGPLLQFKIGYTIVWIGAIYIYIAIGFHLSLLIIYTLAAIVFYLWAHSIRLTISREGVTYKIGISPVQTLCKEEINEITMGFHPYGLGKANLLVIHSINPSKKNIRINYSLLFRRKELALALRKLLELNPQIQANQKTMEFLSDKSYSPYG
jgi:hypothetical protein